jgi:endonuclease YncB( thermonuclease family)
MGGTALAFNILPQRKSRCPIQNQSFFHHSGSDQIGDFLHSWHHRTMKAVILLAVLLYAVSASADYLNCPCKVVKITDGDIVHVLDQSTTKYKIRLSGIDAPEKKQSFGKQSKQNLSGLIAGKNVEVEYKKRDRYGWVIGKLIHQGQDINLLQIKQGYAWHYKYQRGLSSLDRTLYSSAEIVAREQTIGLWSVPAIPPWEFRQK